MNVYELSNPIIDPPYFNKRDRALIDRFIVKNRINEFCRISNQHNLVCCVTKLHIPPQKPRKKVYSSLKTLNETYFELDVSRIRCKWLLTDILNGHTTFKVKSEDENHILYM